MFDLSSYEIEELRQRKKELIQDSNNTIEAYLHVNSENYLDEIDRLDAEILAEQSIIAHAIMIYAETFKRLVARSKWWQFWKKHYTDEDVNLLIALYAEHGENHPHYKTKNSYVDWIIFDVHNEVQKSTKVIQKLKSKKSLIETRFKND